MTRVELKRRYEEARQMASEAHQRAVEAVAAAGETLRQIQEGTK